MGISQEDRIANSYAWNIPAHNAKPQKSKVTENTLRHAAKTRPNRNGEAALYMAASTTTFSFVPVIISNSAIASPFLFRAVWRAGLMIALFSYILARHRQILTNPESRKIITRNIRSPYLIATTA